MLGLESDRYFRSYRVDTESTGCASLLGSNRTAVVETCGEPSRRLAFRGNRVSRSGGPHSVGIVHC